MNTIRLLEQELAGLEHMAKQSKYPTAYSDYIRTLRGEIASLKSKEAAKSNKKVAARKSVTVKTTVRRLIMVTAFAR
jgi:hypothetical protein